MNIKRIIIVTIIVVVLIFLGIYFNEKILNITNDIFSREVNESLIRRRIK